MAEEPYNMRVKDVPEMERPREVMDRYGPRNTPTRMLLAIILRSGVRGMSVLQVADELLRRYGSLTAMEQASATELAQIKGVGKVRGQVLKSVMEIGSRLREEEPPHMPQVKEPGTVYSLLKPHMLHQTQESFWVILLDTKNRLITPPLQLTRGVLDSSLVSAREVFREAIRTSSRSIIVAHNHPSGDPTPSAADRSITRQLIESGALLDIPLLDHIIVAGKCIPGHPDYYSLRQEGSISFKNQQQSAE